MFGICVFAFANYFYMVQLNAEEDNLVLEPDEKYWYVQESLGVPLLDASIAIFFVSLGDFHYEGFVKGHNTQGTWLMLVVA